MRPHPAGKTPSSVSSQVMGWRLLTCRVLPGLVVAAATRPKRWVAINTAPPAHSPCSRSHARLAGRVSTTAGGLLPHRFAPYRPSQGAPAGMLSVAVVVRTRLSPACPHLLFRGATLSCSQFVSQTSRMQDWESGSSSRQQSTLQQIPAQRRLTHWSKQNYTTRKRGYQVSGSGVSHASGHAHRIVIHPPLRYNVHVVGAYALRH
jgi:hypothetical protein